MKHLFILLVSFICCNSVIASSDDDLIKIRNGYEERSQKAFDLLKGKPLVREKIIPPIFSDGSDFSRHYSYSLMDYAFKCFWLEENIDSANVALLENTNYYIGYPRAYKDKDSFYWAADELCKIMEFYGSNGVKKPGLIKKEVEEKVLLMMWQYSKMQSKIAKAELEISNTWFIDESENHHIQRFYAAWHFAKFLKNHPSYKNEKYDDGFTAEEHYTVWNKYIKHWIVERAKKGLFVEMANDSYGLETLKGVYNFHDFGDSELKQLSKNLLDLYWAVWAQEQIGGVSGGAKSRVYPYEAPSGRTTFWRMAWFYLGINEISAPHENLFTLITSNYRMPLLVMDIALDVKGRKVYEIQQRRLGTAEKGFFTPPNYHLKPQGDLLRYSYCTPEFIAGTFFCPAKNYEDWALISSQNRWAGVIYNSHPDARVYATCKTGKDNRAYNQFWSIQKNGSLLVQKLKDSVQSRGAGEMKVFISKAGLSDLQEKDGWVFVSSIDSYTAIRGIQGKYKWEEDKKGMWMIFDEKYTPIRIEVSRKADIGTYTDFQRKILLSKNVIKNNILSYKTLSGDVLSMPLLHKGLPAINGKTIDLNPPMVMSSPFVKSIFDSGVVTIEKDNRKLTLDFISLNKN